MQPTARACVYTCLLGGYEALNEQPVAAASGLDFICFTDDAGLVSESWRIVQVAPALPLDPVRSQRIVKLSPHEMLPGYDLSLYVDNSVVLKVPPEEVIARYLPQETPAAIPGHSFRASVRDEFMEILKLGMDDAGRILEQLNHYQLTLPQVLDDVPFWSAVMIRRHHDPAVIAAMRLWLTHVLRYCRRDQVSGTFAFRQAGLHVARFEVDNHDSWFHRWPVALKRDRDAFPFSPAMSQLPPPVLAEEWLRIRAGMEGRIADLEQALAAAVAAREPPGAEPVAGQDAEAQGHAPAIDAVAPGGEPAPVRPGRRRGLFARMAAALAGDGNKPSRKEP